MTCLAAVVFRIMLWSEREKGIGVVRNVKERKGKEEETEEGLGGFSKRTAPGVRRQKWE